MTLVISDDVYIHAIWFQANPDHSDWMGYVFRQDGGTFRAEWRFRYYADDKVFESEDRKSWTRVDLNVGDDAAAEAFIDTIRVMGQAGEAISGFLPMEIVDIRGKGYGNFKEKTKGIPWMHSKTETLGAN